MEVSFTNEYGNDCDSRIEKMLDEAVPAVYSLLNGLTLARVKA